MGNYEMLMGSFITQENIDNKEMVVVIGTEINESLFGAKNNNSIGETVRIMGQPYRVIGILGEKGSSTIGVSQDRNVFIPLSTAQSRLMTRQKNSVSQVAILVKSDHTIDSAQKEIEALMQERHGIFEGNPNDFTIMNVQEILDAVGSIMSTFTLFLGGVAAISLLVGGIGIMNIMLVTVSERTREIGLRKALGAKKGDILAQFLVESSVLSLVGGLLGIGFGLLLAFGIARIAAATGTDLHVSVNPVIIIGATLFSIGVGLFFGVYPANKASNLEPVIALRSE